MNILAGTEHGLIALDPDPRTLLNAPITALDERDGDLWVLAGGTDLLRGDGRSFEPVASIEGDEGTCILASTAGVLIGTAGAHLLRLDGTAPVRLAGFEAAEGRDAWYTPWGGPPDVRSLTQAADGTLYVNVHVGGILRSRDGGATWEQTIDIDTDIHQVTASPDGHVLAVGAFALHATDDAGSSWIEHTAGFDTTYMRAVAVTAEHILVTSSRSHAGGDAGVYRRLLKSDGPFERCDLPRPLSADNIDTHLLAARDRDAAFITAEGDVWRSFDEGATWEHDPGAAPRPRALLLA